MCEVDFVIFFLKNFVTAHQINHKVWITYYTVSLNVTSRIIIIIIIAAASRNRGLIHNVFSFPPLSFSKTGNTQRGD